MDEESNTPIGLEICNPSGREFYRIPFKGTDNGKAYVVKDNKEIAILKNVLYPVIVTYDDHE